MHILIAQRCVDAQSLISCDDERDPIDVTGPSRRHAPLNESGDPRTGSDCTEIVDKKGSILQVLLRRSVSNISHHRKSPVVYSAIRSSVFLFLGFVRSCPEAGNSVLLVLVLLSLLDHAALPLVIAALLLHLRLFCLL